MIKGKDLGDENRKLTKHIYLVIFRKDKRLTDQLITALSMMSIDKFLDYYEAALKFTHVPGIV